MGHKDKPQKDHITEMTPYDESFLPPNFDLRIELLKFKVNLGETPQDDLSPWVTTDWVKEMIDGMPMSLKPPQQDQFNRIMKKMREDDPSQISSE